MSQVYNLEPPTKGKVCHSLYWKHLVPLYIRLAWLLW